VRERRRARRQIGNGVGGMPLAAGAHSHERGGDGESGHHDEERPSPPHTEE
jgi:hypothetical protein